MKHLPNIITLVNLLMGCFSVLALAANRAELLFYFLPIALLADFLDGLAARLLNAYSELGKQLDSLADLVSFGLVPGLIFYYMIAGSLQVISWWGLLGFAYTIAAAMRLGKFNIDTRQTTQFLGLPTPAGAIMVLGLLYWYLFPEPLWQGLMANLYLQIVGVALLAMALLIELPMFSFKIQPWQWVGNEIKFIFAIAAGILLLIGHFASLPIIIMLYMLLSIGKWLLKSKKEI